MALRLAACVEYDGSAYAGWQSQPHAPSVQATLESALAFVADHPISVVCSGRTDAGVHARGQIVHFDTDAKRPPRAWVFGANSRLPADVSLHWAREVPADFHARYGATAREYRYLIRDRPARSALFAGRAAACRHPLDADVMHAAAQTLLGEHDFSAFRAAACQSKTSWRRLQRLDVARRGEFVIVDVCANAFLHHMVRNLVGTLMSIGRDVRPVSWARELLVAADRSAAGPTAPARGLYLWRVTYPTRYQLPEPAAIDPLLPLGGDC